MSQSSVARRICLGCLMWLIWVCPAVAEENQSQEADQKESNQMANVASLPDTIVVRSSRNDVLLNQAPMAVTVLDAEALDIPNQFLGLDELLASIPGVFFQNRYNFAQNLRISTRGFGARAPFGVRGIALLTDGLPDTLPDGQAQVDAIDLSSLRSVEVIRGPSSMLYGNASGGVIALETEDGEGLAPTMITSLGMGSEGYRRFGLQAGQDAGPWHGWLSVSELEYEGQRRHAATTKRLLNAKGAIRLSDRQKLGWIANVLDQPLGQDPGALTREQVQDDRWQASAQSRSLNAGQQVRQTRVGLTHELLWDAGQTLSSYAFTSDRDFEQQLPSSFFPSLITYQRDFDGFGSAWQWQGAADLSVNVGIDWARQSDDRQRYRVDQQAQIVAMTQNELQQATSQAGFVQLKQTWGRWTGQAGIRWDELKLSIDERGGSMASTAQRNFRQWSLMTGLTFAIDNSSEFFLALGDGFESPTFTEIKDLRGAGGFARSLAPAKAQNHELGFRKRWADQSLAANVYWMDTEDEIVIIEAFDGVDIYDNAGQTKRLGAELAFERQLGTDWHWTLAYTYGRFRFGQFVVTGEQFDGNHLPGLPEHQLFSSLRFDWTDRSSLVIEGLWIDSVFADNANETAISSYGLVNAKIRHQSKPNRWGQVSGFFGVNNLFNQRYFSNIRVNANRGAYFEPGPGRAWFIGLDWQL